MQTLHFSVTQQRLFWLNPCRLPVGDSRGEVFVTFDLDEEWAGRGITVLFSNSFRHGDPVAMHWTGAPLAVPGEVLIPGLLRIGLVGTADEGRRVLPTVWMDKGIPVLRSGGSGGVSPEETAPALWEQVMAAVGNLDELATSDRSSLVAAINEARLSGGGGSGGAGVAIDNVTIVRRNGVLTVNTADAPEQDNTLPITSAAVHTTVGNIEVLLSTI